MFKQRKARIIGIEYIQEKSLVVVFFFLWLLHELEERVMLRECFNFAVGVALNNPIINSFGNVSPFNQGCIFSYYYHDYCYFSNGGPKKMQYDLLKCFSSKNAHKHHQIFRSNDL